MRVSNMTGNIVGGLDGKMSVFSHAVYIASRIFSCGASVLNQAILLTAAHCVYECEDPHWIEAYLGHQLRKQGKQSRVLNFTIHEDFNLKDMRNDIALLRLKESLKFGKFIGRVTLLPKPSYNEEAFVAGWGVTEEGSDMISDKINYISQKVYLREKCGAIGLKGLPRGTICGEHKKKMGYPYSGDSGSALTTKQNVQIGIVSFNRADVSTTNTIFTDVGYYFNWINENAADFYCGTKKKEKLR